MAFCGAKTRQGTPCKNGAMPNGRCRMHGGKSVSQWGNKKAVKHGIYETGLTKEEKKIYDKIPIDTVEDEIRLCKLRIRRALNARKAIEETPNDPSVEFEISEIKQLKGETEGSNSGKATTRQEMNRKRPDFDAIIDRYMGRMSQLIKLREEIKNNTISDPVSTAQEFAQALQAIERTMDNDEFNGPLATVKTD